MKRSKKFIILSTTMVMALVLPQVIFYEKAMADSWFCTAPGDSCIELNINDCYAVHGTVGVCEYGYMTVEACDAATSCTY